MRSSLRKARLVVSLLVAGAAALLLGCEQTANLDGKACPCLADSGYVCCEAQNVCLRKEQLCVDPSVWPVNTTPSAPLPLDDITVYAFSQVDTGGNVPIDDRQLLDLAPDMVIRGWGQWGSYGTRSADYQFGYVERCHQASIRYFMGGAATTILLAGQLLTSADPQNLTSRNADNKPLLRIDDDRNHIYRGSLANPAYREMVVSYGKLQIDGDGMGRNGVDGLHFEEINGGYQGANPQMVADGNEGFDDFHLADFNAYLLAKNPPGTNFADLYDMTADNLLRPQVSPGDLIKNFDYRRYLAAHGWSSTPLIEANPLAKEWGRTTVNRPQPGARTFVDSAEPYYYWKDIVDRLRDYARSMYGRELLITAQGIYPFVDFQSVGLDDHNTDAPDGTPVQYLPTTIAGDGLVHLDGTRSLQQPFRHLKQLSEQFAPGVPVVLFLDGRWPVYDEFPKEGSDHEDFWRLYAAEAYANGLFFAFHLKSSVGIVMMEPTATKLGLMPLFMSLANFYRQHAAYYHGVAPAADGGAVMAAVPSLPSAMIAVMDQRGPGAARPLLRRLVHLVNHEYRPGVGIVHQDNITVTIASPTMPRAVSLASPDFAADVTVENFSYADGQVVVAIPSLDAYVVVSLSY